VEGAAVASHEALLPPALDVLVLLEPQPAAVRATTRPSPAYASFFDACICFSPVVVSPQSA
jgi:hypothetical protein